VEAVVEPGRKLQREEQGYAVKTWRYLRVAMIALAAGLLVSIVYEIGDEGWDCVQTSISAYYYTPVHGYFVGALLSIGVCLFCLKGSTEREDVLLNLAGMFALIVALVPTADPGACASVLRDDAARYDSVDNNVTALITVGLAALIFIALLGWLDDEDRGRPTHIGFFIAGGLLVVTMLVFSRARDRFVGSAHFTAAVLMFACIFLAVCSNALQAGRTRGKSSTRNLYIGVAATMGVSVLAFGFAWLVDWDHRVLAIEAALIVLFAMFWVIQTFELWNEGLRPPAAAPPLHAPTGGHET
jgi:drug/metabolite transporter (DMT)-like permease